jgi:hypothetical protein
MKLWIDDLRPAPEGYRCINSVNEAKEFIIFCENSARSANKYRLWNLVDHYMIELIDIDHDAGDFACDGGDYIRLLDWLEETGRNYPIHIHSANTVGVQNMRAIIQHNGWKEVL